MTLQMHPPSRARVLSAVLAAVVLGAVLTSRILAQTAEKWDPAIARFEAQDKVAPPPQNGIVFIGASSIVRWNLPESFPELGAEAINRGFGGSQSVDSVRYVERIVIPYRPRTVVYYAGDNDVEAGVPASEIAHQFARFEQKVHAALPGTRVIFISIKPSIRRWKWVDTIRTANALVKAYCLKAGNTRFVDIENQMLGADGKPNPDLLVADGLHMTPAGYRVWTEALKPVLQ
ncbi:MAG TPA: GDSL-type esterase/lipase family protein [Vicinamibacterales bacterium]|nr:GDSL-type esterase/lipase family protein [Vicinamibacterales bacterium]